MSPINVAKFGGTSVANAAAMNNCADVVLANPATRVVVLSASAGVTNLLVALAQGDLDEAGQEAQLARLTEIQQAIAELKAAAVQRAENLGTSNLGAENVGASPPRTSADSDKQP